ncbi:polysaccharide biosynthesis protein [Granulosicoccus antarcticus]|uniref:UDP-N-acetyl-alpha-D-glucosamine C6 dehydratase n=1 Tax=Granulosicoccus antarcticus IMCC3135 TaxID=1192854 RepID=A0A2Z2NTD3_9GAMM|nr:nucleoside-diphosphate sugar epimerase/dehydratase [Granulosicoccus antarcticus]ASJ74579.1 UDP-N-acetyl-alpha-D-glucosamine C6 dehydratase [Granulosicoccus antarcticus IMCC3135]
MQQQSGQFSLVPSFVKGMAKNLSATGRGRKQIIGMSIDACMVIVSLSAAYALRVGELNVVHFSYQFLLLLPLTVLVFMGLGIYRWIVRSSTLGLFYQVVKGAVCSAFILLLLLYLIPPESSHPRSIFIIYGLVLGMLCCGYRMLWKAFFSSHRKGATVAIFGAGAAGIKLASILKNGEEYRPVCFIDDDNAVVGSTIMGRRVLNGRVKNLQSQLLRLEVSQVIIAIPSLDSEHYSNIYDRLDAVGIPFKTSPSSVELLSGRSAISEIREVSVTDILGRNEALPDPRLLQSAIAGKSILVTGGGGSIGSEICRQIIMQMPRRLVVLDNSEANLYHIGEEMLQLLANTSDLAAIEFDTILCSVADRARIKQIFTETHFDTVYHAAAYKHVPIIERFPEQGAEVNVFGTLNVLDAAISAGVGRFVLISTDKAVRPTNAMGATKRVAEMVLQAKARNSGSTIISMVRFGNVLASNGSVVPKFRRQIAAGGPITLTHPDITRYFMTIPEASQLVIQASAISKGGDVFVLDMGEPIKIAQLAETMIKLHCQRVEQAGGMRPDITIKITGLRPGEKMYEELFIDDSCQRTSVEKVMSADEQHLSWDKLEPQLVRLRSVLVGAKPELVRERLFDIVYHTDQQLKATDESSSVEGSEVQQLSAVHS